MPSSGLTVPNTFATQSGNVPASQLDTNFSQAVGALNALSTFSNYYVDSGAVNSIVITVPAPLAVSYAAGLALQIKVAVTNTGATTINVNGLGANAVVFPNGGAITAGLLVAGAVIQVMFDGTNFQYLGNIPAGGGGGNANVTTGSFTGTLLGVSGTVTGTMSYSIVTTGSVGICTLFTASLIQGTSNAVGFSMSGVPSVINPPTPQFIQCSLTVAGAVTLAVCQVASNFLNFNTMLWTGSLIQAGNFPASGTKGLPSGFSITYALS